MAKEQIIMLDDLLNECGYFDSNITDDGFGCRHRRNGERCCDSADCPIADPANLTDLKRLDNHLYNEWREYFPPDASEDDSYPRHFGSDWMVWWGKKYMPRKKTQAI